MKKILSAVIIFCVMIFSANCQAGVVRVSDYTVNEFVSNYNKIVNGFPNELDYKQDIFIKNNPTYASSMSNSIYDAYDLFCGPEGHGTILIFFANKQGHVSKIGLLTSSGDTISKTVATYITLTILTTLGLSASEVSALAQNGGSVWCNAKNRYICIQRSTPNYDLIKVEFYAVS